MDEMLRYILGVVKDTETTVTRAAKSLKRLKKTNRHLQLFVVATAGLVVWSEIKRCEQAEKIEELSIKVRKLERIEGE